MSTAPGTPRSRAVGWLPQRVLPTVNYSPVSPVSDSPPSLNSERASNSEKFSKQINIPRWPQEPQKLHRGGIISALSCLGDIVVILISIVFFVYGGIVLKYDGVATASILYKAKLIDAARYGPTVFPILFAAVVSQALHSIALWRLERGERLGVLDQLFGSTAIFATVTTQLKLRAVGPVAISLILLWSLSPVGGQASLRVLGFAREFTHTPVTMRYLDINGSLIRGDDVAVTGEGDSTSFSQLQKSLFIAALLSPPSTKSSSMDTWGNVKIPMMESLNTSSTSDGWHAVDANSSVYSSLIGIPVSAVADRANTTFSLETSYWALDCPRLEEYGNDMRDTDNYDWIEAQDYSWALKTERIADNSSRHLALTSNTNDPPPRNWVYFSYDDTDKALMSYAECTMRTRHVEVQVHCKGRSCEVVRMRDSTLPHLPSGWTFLDDSYQNTYIFTLNLQQAVMANMFTPSAVQRYFTNPGSPFNTTAKMPRLYTVGPKSFAISFAQLLNTFWLAGIGAFVVPGGIPHSDSNLGNGTNVLQATNAVMSESEEILVCDKRWLATLLVSTSAMFIAGVVGLALGFVRRGPNLAMDIATMTRDNPYMNLPQGGSALDCAERSRLLRNVRVRFGDVAPHGEVGYAAVASLAHDKDVEMLKEKRLYA